MSLSRTCRACLKLRLPMPKIPVPEELGQKKWTLAPAVWFISGESRFRSEGETDNSYIKRVLKNKWNRDSRLAIREQEDRDHFAYWGGTEEPEETLDDGAQIEPVKDWEQEAQYWQRRCRTTEDRLTSVVTAVGRLSRLAKLEGQTSDTEESYDEAETSDSDGSTL